MARRGANRREQRKARRAERSSARQQRRDRKSARQQARADRRQTRASRADTRRAEKTARAQARQDAKIAKQQEKTARRDAREAGRGERSANRQEFFKSAAEGLGTFFGEDGLGRDILGGIAPGIFGGEEELEGFELAGFEGFEPEPPPPPTALERIEDSTGLPPAAILGGLALAAAGVGYFLLRKR
jgi:multidrug efflux pump subunit AcrA (membrane-fusion protein)